MRVSSRLFVRACLIGPLGLIRLISLISLISGFGGLGLVVGCGGALPSLGDAPIDPSVEPLEVRRLTRVQHAEPGSEPPAPEPSPPSHPPMNASPPEDPRDVFLRLVPGATPEDIFGLCEASGVHCQVLLLSSPDRLYLLSDLSGALRDQFAAAPWVRSQKLTHSTQAQRDGKVGTRPGSDLIHGQAIIHLGIDESIMAIVERYADVGCELAFSADYPRGHWYIVHVDPDRIDIETFVAEVNARHGEPIAYPDQVTRVDG